MNYAKKNYTETMGMAGYVKKFFILLCALAMVLIVGRRALYLLGIWKVKVEPSSAYLFPTTGAPYNFGRMLELVEASRDVQKAFYAHFSSPTMRKKNIDIQALKDLLAELYRERVRLLSFLQELKGNSKETISVKQRRALLYYVKVLGKSATSIEAIIRKI